MKFHAFDLHPHVSAGVAAAGFDEPTPIQKQAIPPALRGLDVMGLAQTGTGKTAAFVLPLLHQLMQGERRKVRALIVAPTRELAEQIHETISFLGRQTRLRSVTVYGGASFHVQAERLKRGAEIVVACPGRLLDHVTQKTINLSHVEMLVLDEADRMFDMGFLPDVRKIISHVPVKRQTLMFSATMPDDIRHLVRDVLCNPVTAQVSHSVPAHTVSHAFYPVAQHLKMPLLFELLLQNNTGPVLVFTRTKQRAKRVAEQLLKAGCRAASLQGNLSQNRRQQALDGFRKGIHQVLVATDIAARGIDVSDISHVINFDMPDTVDAYTHRIGRTGRAEKNGDAFTFITGEDETMVRSIERVLRQKIERRLIQGFDYGKPAPRHEAGSAGQVHHPRGSVQKKSPVHARVGRDAHSPRGRHGAAASASSSQKTPLREGRRTAGQRVGATVK